MHIHLTTLPVLTTVGITVLGSLYSGKLANRVKLPSLIGFMLVGVLVGPSFLDMLDESFQERLSFITEIALAFVAVSIGLELSLPSLRKLGTSIVYIIFSESFGAFLVVGTLVFLVVRDLPTALIFGSIAPASAPAGTVAIIKEYRARGPLTQALYAVVGFDDGLGIVIFGFAAAIARSLLGVESGMEQEGLLMMIVDPVVEIVGGVAIGVVAAMTFTFLGRLLKNSRDLFILLFAMVLTVSGLCAAFHFSIILTNMILGMVIVNTQPVHFTRRIHDELANIMPLLFVLFFSLAGAHLNIAALPSLGLIGLVYILGRMTGLIGGARLGALLGKAPATIRKYLGLGILSQAGVAIGLSLIVKHDFAGLGPVVDGGKTSGDLLGTTVLTTVTATCIFFEILGPILTKFALGRAGELHKEA